MTKVIDLNLPTKYFIKDRNNRLEARLARFDLQKGNILRFHEVDDKGNRTGKYFDRKVIDFHKIHRATKYWKKKDLLKYGLYVMELGDYS